MCVCVCLTAQPQLPRGETTLRVPAQQVGPHQAANSWFWPAQGSVLVLRAQHTTSSLISIEKGVSNQEGVSNWLLFINTPSVTASARAPLPPPLLLPFSHHPFSFLASFFDLWFHWLHCCLQPWKSHFEFTPHLLLSLFLLNELLWNFIPLDQWQGLPACVKGFGEKTSTLLNFEGLHLQAKKKEQKKYFWASENINLYLSKKKKERGRSIYFGTRSAKKSPQMIYCLTFVENNAKKIYRGPYVFWLCEAILHARSIMSSHLAKMSLLPHFLSDHRNCTG